MKKMQGDRLPVSVFPLTQLMIGQAIKNLSIHRDDLILATKVKVSMRKGENNRALSEAYDLASGREPEKTGDRLYDLYQIYTACWTHG